MRKMIYFCRVTIAELSKRGKTISEKAIITIDMPTKSLSVDELYACHDDIAYITKKQYDKVNAEHIKHFLDNHRIKSVEKLKELGESVDLESKEDLEEWI